MYPDFLIIGAQKAGTTWLHHNLLQHPGIWMPKEKELHYFDEKIHEDLSLHTRLFGDRPPEKRWRRQVKRQLRGYKKGVSWWDLMWDLNYFLRTPSDRWYASLFNQGKGRLTGETTPDYSVLDRQTIAHVHSLMPEAKIIFIMRNPIERVWSRLVMAAGDAGHKDVENLPEQYFRKQLESSRSQDMTDYQEILEHWAEFYPHDRIFVGFTEDIGFYPGRFMKAVHNFLGTDPSEARRVITRKVHTSSRDALPTRVGSRIAELHRADIEELSERFGAYATFWDYCAQRLSDDPPEQKSLEYPLYKSSLWQQWREESQVELNGPRSGPLSSVTLDGKKG